MAGRIPVIFAVVLALLGLTMNDWLPTGVFTEVGSFGNTDRRNALRVFSIVAPILALALCLWRQWLARNAINLAIALVSTIVALTIFVAVDLYLSAGAVKRTIENRESRSVHIEDPLLGWRPRPESVSRHREPGSFDVRYTIDAAGLKAIPNQGEPTARLLIFGDSYTFGHGVENEATYANIIANEYLRPSVHVFNYGVMGYGIEQMYGRFLEVESELREGDIVLFAPTSQDLKRNFKDFVFPSKLIFHEVIDFGSVYPYYRNGELEPRELMSAENRRLAALFNGRWSNKVFRFLHSAIMSPPTSAEALEMIGYVRAKSMRSGAVFRLIFLPQLKERARNKHEEDVSFFDYIDVMHAFPQDTAELAALRFPIDSHWNERGHRIAASAIMDALVKSGALSAKHLLDR